jgi:hypothetical protein
MRARIFFYTWQEKSYTAMYRGNSTNITGFISGTRAILNELYASKEAGNVLGIWCTSRPGKEMIMCTVESIHEDHLENDKAIVVKELTSNGQVMKSHLLHLKQIEKVHQFKPMRTDKA